MLNLEKGDKVILKGFTGIKLGVFEVARVTDKTVTVLKKDGSKMIFSKKTGKQINVEEGKERFANSIMEDDGSYVAPKRGRKKKASSKKVSKKPIVEEVDEALEEDFEEIDEDFEKPEPVRKKTSSKKPKKKTEEDFDEFEDFEDFDEFEDEDF